MDIHCPICGEPWDADELHDAPMPYIEALREFRVSGCAALGSRHGDGAATTEHRILAELAQDVEDLAL